MPRGGWWRSSQGPGDRLADLRTALDYSRKIRASRVPYPWLGRVRARGRGYRSPESQGNDVLWGSLRRTPGELLLRNEGGPFRRSMLGWPCLKRGPLEERGVDYCPPWEEEDTQKRAPRIPPPKNAGRCRCARRLLFERRQSCHPRKMRCGRGPQ